MGKCLNYVDMHLLVAEFQAGLKPEVCICTRSILQDWLYKL